MSRDVLRSGDRFWQDRRATTWNCWRGLREIAALGRPVLIGTSRKSFLGPSRAASLSVDERLAGTIATNVLAFERGARVFRVHDVAPFVMRCS